MAILVNKDTKVCVQGITGRDGSFHSHRMAEYGTHIVGGTRPGKGGAEHEGFGRAAVPQLGASGRVQVHVQVGIGGRDA